MISVKFGDYDMQASGVVVTSTDIYSAPTNNIQADTLAEADGALIVKQQFKPKTFKLEGYIQKDTASDLESALDTFKAALATKNQALDIGHAGGLRRYLANAQNIIIGQRQPTTVTFSIEFLSPDGMGWDLESTALISALNVTDSSHDESITVGGSYLAEPLVTVNIGSVSGGTSKALTISNGTSLRGISVTRTWAASDVLEIDSLLKTVFVNNEPAEFSGQFPSWTPGDSIIGYLDDFTSRSVTINASYTKRWL